MELNIRMLKDSDWNTLVEWWDAWPEWHTPAKDFLPENGTGGFIVEKQDKPIVAGFLYTTNSKAALLEWIVSNPKYREDDREKAKSDRISQQNTEQSELINQRKNNLPPKNFESNEDSLDGFDLAEFEPR